MRIHDGWNMDRAEARRNPTPAEGARPVEEASRAGFHLFPNARVLGLLLVSVGASMLCGQG